MGAVWRTLIVLLHICTLGVLLIPHLILAVIFRLGRSNG